MDRCEFYRKLSETSSTYSWEVSSSQSLTTTGKRGRTSHYKSIQSWQQSSSSRENPVSIGDLKA